MAKLTLTDISSIQNDTQAVNKINSNNALIETAFENTLSRDGSSPNQMNANIDLNSYRILNLPAPVNDSEPLRKGDIGSLGSLFGTFTASINGLVPASGVANGTKVLYDNGTWAVPPGATGGEANTASNLGAGEGVYASKSGVELRFKSFADTSEIVASSNSTEISFSLGATLDFSSKTITWPANTIATGNIQNNAVTLAKLATELQKYLVPTGSMIFFGGTSAPNDQFLLCQGQAVSRTTYSALFAVLGTAFGSGDGSTTFNLPDMRGRFPRGFDAGAGVDSGRVFGSTQNDAFQGHWHQFTFDGVTWSSGGGSYVPNVNPASPDDRTGTDDVKNPINDGTNGTPRTASETRPKNVAANWIIKV